MIKTVVMAGGSGSRLWPLSRSLYPNEITDSTTYSADKENLLLPHVNFVAIKNGMHQGKGFAFFSKGMVEHAPVNESHVAELGNSIKRYFNISC